MSKHINKKGFTLIELSIVLVIIGILVSASLKLVGPISQIVKMRETKDRLDTAVQSVTGYAATRNAVLQNLSSLTVPRSSWGKDFAYLYDANFYAANPTKDTICGRSRSNLTIHTQEPNVSTPDVVFAVVSSTEDYDFNSILDAEPSAINGRTFPLTGTHTLHIDVNNKDIMRLVTVSDLRTKIGCQGAPLKIVNNELPKGKATTAYSATIYADGGVPFASSPSTYKFCINTMSDPDFTINGTTGFFNANCLTADTSAWSAATASTGVKLEYLANSVAADSYPVTVVARDTTANDNQVSKVFVITVDP